MRTPLNAAETDSSQTRSIEKKAVALVGSPNSGKTTLFNWLTGSRFKTVNYPGATVDYSVGRTHTRYGESLIVMDTPGTYSLDPKSPDERVTKAALLNHKEFGAAQLVVSVVDATQLSRHLLLTRQLIDSGFSVVLAVTMDDLLRERNERIDVHELKSELGVPVVLIDGRLGGGVRDLVSTLRGELNRLSDATGGERKPRPIEPWSAEKVESVLRETFELERKILGPLPTVGSQEAHDPQRETPEKKSTAAERTRQLDRFLLHPVAGLVIFAAFMVGLFSSIFWAAAPLMDFVDGGLTWLAESVLAIQPENLILQFLANGVIASLAAVLVFVPQIFILFVGIVLLEDSGYLARSATLIDKPLSLLGLGGRSFVPLLSGYACAVPAMMAARTINSPKERWLTLFVIPLMSCSARLPVYALLLAFLFKDQAAWKPGLMLAGLYLGSLVVGALAALIAGRFIKMADRSFFMLELPVYRAPLPKNVLRQALTRTKSYVKRAGPPIFLFALIVWLGTTFPNYKAEDATERLNSSFAARAGQIIEPVFEPMGGDWRTGVGLISAFAAREVFVSSLAVVFHVADDNEDSMQETLLQKMQSAQAPSGYPLFTVASVLGLIVFFMIALQCLSTVMVAAKEAGGWKFAVVQLIIFNVAAYILAVAIVQGLRAIGIA